MIRVTQVIFNRLCSICVTVPPMGVDLSIHPYTMTLDKCEDVYTPGWEGQI